MLEAQKSICIVCKRTSGIEREREERQQTAGKWDDTMNMNRQCNNDRILIFPYFYNEVWDGGMKKWTSEEKSNTDLLRTHISFRIKHWHVNTNVPLFKHFRNLSSSKLAGPPLKRNFFYVWYYLLSNETHT